MEKISYTDTPVVELVQRIFLKVDTSTALWTRYGFGLLAIVLGVTLISSGQSLTIGFSLFIGLLIAHQIYRARILNRLVLKQVSYYLKPTDELHRISKSLFGDQGSLDDDIDDTIKLGLSIGVRRKIEHFYSKCFTYGSFVFVAFILINNAKSI